MSPFRRFGAFAALLLAAASAHGQTYTHQVYLDRDQDSASGCSVATAAGNVAGVDARLTATISEYPASIAGLTLAECSAGSFGAEAAIAGAYPVGYDLGTGGSDVIEFAVDVAALGGASGENWTLWFVSTSQATGGVDLFGPIAAPGLGGPQGPGALPAPAIIPAVDPWALLLLSLAMGVAVVWAARRYRGLLPVLLIGAALSVTGIAWAANYLLDGAIGDWDVAPLGTDASGDTTTGEPPIDLGAVFAAREGGRVFFRADVAEAQIEKLIAGLLSTAFTVDENPANGTVVGELRAVTTGLGSLLQFQLLGQTPANAFAVDADGTLTVADGSLVDAEATPVFTLDVQVSINGVAALTIQVDVTVTVDGVNEAPVVDAATFSIPENSVDGAGVGTVTFTDPDTGQAHTLAITAGDAGGVFAIDAGTGAITVADASQLDFATTPSYALTVTVTDNGTPALSGSATVTIDITETDEPPVAVADAATVAEDAAATAIDVLGNDTDTDAGPLLVESVTQPGNGTVLITGGGTGVTYAPNADYCNDGSPVDSFGYTLNGGSSATVSVTVTCVDDDPVAVDDAATVAEDNASPPILVLANDTDVDAGAAMSIASVTQPANGVVTIALDNLSVSYTPNADYCNDGVPLDTFTYTLAPGGSTATVSVTVTCVDDLPVAVDDAAVVAEDSGANTLDVLANDTDVDAGPLSIASVTQPANGTVAITNGGADLSYTPNANYCNDGSPVDSFTYTLNGGSSATVGVTIPCGDDAPLAVADAATVTEDDPATAIDVLANDTDIDGGPMLVQSVTQPSNGAVVITNAGADLTYAPDADYCNDGSPLDTFTYTLNGGSTATVSVTVTCVNDGPAIDLDADDSEGTAGTDYTLPYVEGDGAMPLQDAIDAVITDIDSTTLVSLTVTLTNLIDAGEELLDADVSAFAPDITKAWDTTTPGVGVLTISSVAPQPLGDYIAVLRTVTYANSSDTPDITTRAVEFVANDGALDSNTATAFVNLSGVDTAPVAVADAATVAEDAGASAIDVLANDTDSDGGPISIDLVSQPANGTVVITGGGTGLTYAPDANYCNDPPGTTLDTFTYALTPGGDTATVSVTVTCDDDAPILDLDADDSEGTAGAGYTLAYVEGDGAMPVQDATDAEITDVDSTTLVSLTVTLTNLIDAGEELLDADVSGFAGITKSYDTTTPGVGVLTLSSGVAQPLADYVAVLRTVTYANSSDTPDTTTRAVEFVANDGALDSNTATAFVNLSGVDTAPVAVADAATVAEDAGASAIDVLANDTDSDGGPISIDLVSQPANGTVVITGGGTGLTYAPDANYCNDPPGTTLDTFTYTLTPGGDTATVSVTVTCVDDDPVAVADAATVGEDSGANAIDVLANDTDPDGGAISVTSVTQPTNGAVAITGGGTGVSYTPNANYCNNPPGTTLDTFTYTLAPGGSSTTVTVTVTCVEDDPVAVADAATVAEDSGANAIDVLANDTDPDGGSNSVTSVTQPTNGTVAITGGGTGVSYAPNANYCNNPPGTTLDTFTYTLTPGGSTTTVTVTVTCVDDPPVAVADAATVIEDDPAAAIDVLANDTDVDGGLLEVASVTQAANGAVAITGGGTGLTYTPNANYCNDGSPLDTFTYTLNGSSSTTVSVTVTCVNDAPTVTAPAATYQALGNVSIAVAAASPNGLLNTVADVDGPTPIIVQSASYSSAQGGNVTVDTATGAWTYNPPAGYEGADSFQYTVCDSFLPTAACSAPATVNLSVSGMVWFVDSTAAACTLRANGCGRLNTPYSTLAAFQAENDGGVGGLNPAAGDSIFLFERATAYVGPVTLLNNQELIGQDATATLASIAGVTVPTFSAALPAMTPAAGSTTALTSTTDAIRIAQGANATVRGLSIGNVSNSGTAINMNTAATAFGTLVVGDSVAPDVSIVTNGRILNLASGVLTANLVQTTTSGGTQQGIALSSVTGTLAPGAGGIAGTTGNAIQVTGAMPNISWAGSVSKTSAGRLVTVTGAGGGNLTLSGTLTCNGGCTGIEIASRNAGTLTFSGTSKVLNTFTSAAVTATGNAGATIAFSNGGLDIDTTTGTGMSVTGTGPAATTGGTVTVTGSGNSINASSGVALNIVNSTIGAGGLLFQRIDAGNNTVASDPANGILLNNTGVLGGLTVTGTGTAGSGGTIQNVAGGDGAVAGNGIHLTNAQQLSLSWMNLTTSSNNGMFGTGVRGLTMHGMQFGGNHGTSNSGAFNESAVHLQDLGGTVGFTDSTFNGGAMNAVRIDNVLGTAPVLALTIDNATVSDLQGSVMDVRGTAILFTATDGDADVTIANSDITEWWGNAIHVLMQGAATGHALIADNFADNTNGALAGAGGIWVAGCSMSFDVTGNSVRNTNGTAISADKSNCASGTLQGVIDNNLIGESGVANSGSGTGIGIFVAGRNGTTTVRVSNNVLRQINGSANGAITTVIGDAAAFSPAGTLNATIVGNNIQESGTLVNNAQHGIYINHGVTSSSPGDSHAACYDIGGAGALANSITNFISGTANNRIRVNQRFTGVSRFPGYTGANTDNNALVTYLLGRNTASTALAGNNVATWGGQGFTNTVPAGSACPQPVLPTP